MASKKKKKVVDPIQQSEDYIAFLQRALNSENFKRECLEDETGKKQAKYDKYKRSYEKEKLKLKFLKMDRNGK